MNAAHALAADTVVDLHSDTMMDAPTDAGQVVSDHAWSSLSGSSMGAAVALEALAHAEAHRLALRCAEAWSQSEIRSRLAGMRIVCVGLFGHVCWDGDLRVSKREYLRRAAALQAAWAMHNEIVCLRTVLARY